jgi:DNA-directed RNA polymerase beta' subunit
VDDLQNVVTEYMKSSSFSVGISDLIANKKTQDAIIQVVNKQKLEVQSIIEKVHLGVFKNETSASNASEFETQVNNILNKATEQAGKIGRESLSKDNRFLMIVESGSKGSLINISQMISCLGQQNVDGKRIPYGFDSRTLPHYKKFDDSPAARGFIENSYISGLTAPQVFAHAMGGRIGLIDTAVKTSQTGYIQRRLIKALEDIQMEYDGTVRNSKKVVVQFRYGDDGMDSTKAENQIIPLVGMTAEDIYMHYDIPGLTAGDKSSARDVYTKATFTRMGRQHDKTVEMCKKYIDMMIEARDTVVSNIFGNKNENTVKVPVAFQYIISNIQGQLNLGPNSTVDITPLEAFEIIEEGFAALSHIHYTQPTELFKILYYYYLSPKDLLFNKRYHKKGLEVLIETIHLKYKQAIVSPGEMVGVIAGQSIGEPTTQLTLNSVIYETEILVRNSKKEIKRVKIGDFIEDQIQKSEKIDYTQGVNTTYAELNPDVEYYEVPGSTESGETVWRRIEAVTRHPVINEDGTNTMLKVKTKGCREVVATKAKSFLQMVDGKIVGVNGKDLKVGDYLPVSKKQLEFTGIERDYIYGFKYGETLDEPKGISDEIQFSSEECRIGFLNAYISKNGIISQNPSKINVFGSSREFSLDFMILLKNLGIMSDVSDVSENSKYTIEIKNEEAHKLGKIINIGHMNDQIQNLLKEPLQISEEYLTVPNMVDGITIMQPREKLAPDLIFDKIVSIEEVPNTTQYAYDLTVEETRTFDTVCGLNLFDTFHLAGVASKSNVTRGVPRIEEILRLTKNQKNPSLTIHLHPFDETDRMKASSFANMLEHTRLVDVVKSVQIYFDPIENSTFLQEDKELIDRFYEFDRMIDDAISNSPSSAGQLDIRGGGGSQPQPLPSLQQGPEKSKWIIRMEFDAEILLDRNITMDDIHFAISNTYGDEVSCTYSDFNQSNLVFRIRLNSSVFDKSKKKRGQIESLDQSDEIYLLRNFQDALLKNIVLRGVSGISNVIPRKLQNMVVKNDGKYINQDVWILDTTGSNLLSVLALDYIDSTRTYSNNIREIFDVLGIEAARQIIYNELIEVMEFADVYINYHHVSLLCDRMTMLENMVPIFRSGIFSDDIGPIAKATYEVHTEVFLDAARHAEIDHMRGVSANVMCGQYGNYGTNAFNLVLDMEEMRKLKEATLVIRNENREIEELFELNQENEGDACSRTNLTIENHIESIQNTSRANMCNDNYDMGF